MNITLHLAKQKSTPFKISIQIFLLFAFERVRLNDIGNMSLKKQKTFCESGTG